MLLFQEASQLSPPDELDDELEELDDELEEELLDDELEEELLELDDELLDPLPEGLAQSPKSLQALL